MLIKRKKKQPVKFGLGDVVQLNKFWNNRVGLVFADDKAWWVTTNHFDIAHCICEAKDVVRVINKGAVPRKYLKYTH